MPNGARCRRRPPRRSTRRARGAGASSRSAPRRCGCSRAPPREDGTIAPFAGETDIFITPGYRFRAVDVLMTNFHLPRSTLFMLVCAFAGLDAHAGGLRARDRATAIASTPTATRACCSRHSGATEVEPGPATGRDGLRCAEPDRGSGPRSLGLGMTELSMTDTFTFTVTATDGAARTGEIRMPRGVIRTPAFMPVGTAGTVKAMYPDQVQGARRRHRARQHLSSDAASRRRARRARSAACTGS